jgi:DNA-binding winged helix-turn-helix (wHTH) protein
MQRVSHQTRSFDGFTLDLTRGCLLRGTQEVELAPIPFEALKYLVDNPGRLISNAELTQTLWPNTAVTPDSLVQCLREVRIALRDKDKKIIKNVPRRGYIFELEVRDNASSPPVTTYTEETGVQLIMEEEEIDGRSYRNQTVARFRQCESDRGAPAHMYRAAGDSNHGA